MLHILLAEDNRGDVLLVRQALDDHSIDYQLHIVHDGAQAIDFIQRMGLDGQVPFPDIMLLDLNLPKAEGQQILSAFHKRPECSATPVIVVSSSDAPRDRARMAELGVAHYFRKPSELDEFMRLGALIRETVGDGRPKARMLTGIA